MFKWIRHLLKCDKGVVLKQELSEISTPILRQKFISQAEEASRKLRIFAQVEHQTVSFVSLGQNCSSSWYLKQLGLKQASYPFDWIFSSPEIIMDCIGDNFTKFLDKNLIVENQGGLSAGHKTYHTNMFNHRNPLRNQEDFDYYQRCCNRFLTDIKSTAPKIYLMTLINEPEKRQMWAKGFTEAFKMPRKQKLSEFQDFIRYFKTCDPHAKFIIVDHYTEQEQSVAAEIVSDDIFLLRFCAGGTSDGVLYQDALDDFCFKLILSGLCS